MEGTSIFEGTIKIEPDAGKVYLEYHNRIMDINSFLQKLTGERVVITISPPEKESIGVKN